ncbi:MAG: diguanylate cyclase [bacterium]|nr:diguanylate cyclase [bacterium]
MSEKLLISSKLRLFLVLGVRLLGVFVALALTGAHNPRNAYNPLPIELDTLPTIITAAVLIYQITAGVLASKCTSKGVIPITLVVCDVLMGSALTYYYGPAYLILAYTLPVLTIGLYYGNSAAISTMVLGGLFYGIIIAASFVGKMEEGMDQIVALSKLAGVEFVATFLLMWLFNSTLAEAEDRLKNENRLQQEKDMLFQEIQTAKSEVAQVYQTLSEAEGKSRSLQRDNASLKEELDTSIKRLQEARIDLQEAEKKAAEEGREASQTARREKIQIQRQLANLQRRFERQNRLFEMSRKLSGSLALSDTLLALTEQLQAFLPCQSCVIFMIDEVQGHQELFAEVAASPFTDIFRNYSLQIGEGAPGYAVSKLTSFKIDKGTAEVGGVKLSTVVEEERSALVSPLAIPSQTIGVVYLGRAEEDAFTEQELDLLVDFCEMASVSLGNSILYQRAVTQGLNDVLTGCHNSLFLEERMREELKRGNRYMYSVSLILVDIDGFGQINEVLGKDVGDCVLRETAELLRKATRETDVLARLDADDFAVLLDHSDRSNSFEVGRRICEQIAGHVFTFGGRKIRITVSVGVAGSPHDAANAEQLTMRAAEALQQAKGAGGNQVAFWNGGKE